MKICTKCRETKEFSAFTRSKTHRDGFKNQCKTCVNIYSKKYMNEYRKNNREKIKKIQANYRQNNKDKIALYRKAIKDKTAVRQKIYRETHRDKAILYGKQYRIKNKDILYKKEKAYKIKKLKSDPLYKLAYTIRKRTRIAFKSKNFNKKNKLTEYLGCTVKEAKNYLTSLFQPGMTWENHGEWHIDHIIPLSSAATEEEMYKLCYYTNLQPLWAEDNLKKGSKIY